MNRSQSFALAWFAFCAVTATAADPVSIAQGSGAQAPKQPQVAVSKDGTVHLVFGVGETVQYARSTDGGQTFSKPGEAFRVSNMPLGRRRGPRVVAVEGAVVVTAIGGQQGKGRDGDVEAWRSIDGGKSWSGPVRVNDVAASAREGLHAMAAGPDGAVWCTWLDLREKQMEIYAAKSTDGGATWSSNICVYRSPDGHVCECCHPSIAVDRNGVHVMFRNWLDGNRDMYVATSKDGGQSFSDATKLGLGVWKLDACPMDGGMLASGENGTLVTVWRRDKQVFYASTAGGKEQLLGTGEQPWVSSSPSGPIIVWTSGREGADLWLQRAGTKQPQKLTSSAGFPMVAASVDGKGPVIACWESSRNGQMMVVALRVDAVK
jgi:hypothetical protein